jgi:ribose transport system substrate-binding protein
MDYMKKINLLLIACLVTLLPACNDNHPSTAAAGNKLRLAFVANNANDYWAIVRMGCDSAVKQLGDVDLEFRIPASRTPAAQQETISQLLAEGVDGIAISPIDAEQQAEFLNSIPTNVLLICADSDAPKSRRAFYVGSDNVAAGKQAADLLKAALPQGGKVALFAGYPNAQNMTERIAGIKAGLAGSNIEIIALLADGQNAGVAQKNAEDALAKYPDLAGLAGLNSYTGPAILQAVHSAGKVGRVKIVCFDDDSDTLAGIAAGDIFGTVVQRPFWIGHDAITEMAGWLRGDKRTLGAGKSFKTQVVTKENAATFQLERKNILEK